MYIYVMISQQVQCPRGSERHSAGGGDSKPPSLPRRLARVAQTTTTKIRKDRRFQFFTPKKAEGRILPAWSVFH